jgi:hypothetical protein
MTTTRTLRQPVVLLLASLAWHRVGAGEVGFDGKDARPARRPQCWVFQPEVFRRHQLGLTAGSRSFSSKESIISQKLRDFHGAGVSRDERRNSPPIQQNTNLMKTLSIISSVAAVGLFVAGAALAAGEPLLSPHAKELQVHRTTGVTEERIDRAAPMVPGKLFGQRPAASNATDDSGAMACCMSKKSDVGAKSCGMDHMNHKGHARGMACGG